MKIYGRLLLLLALGPILFTKGNAAKLDKNVVPSDQKTDELKISNGAVKKNARTKRDILIFMDPMAGLDAGITCLRPLRDCNTRCPPSMCVCNYYDTCDFYARF